MERFQKFLQQMQTSHVFVHKDFIETLHHEMKRDNSSFNITSRILYKSQGDLYYLLKCIMIAQYREYIEISLFFLKIKIN